MIKNIGIIGAGSIGSHLAKLIYRNKLGHHISIADKNMWKARAQIIESGTTEEVIQSSSILFLTVKPNNIKEVCLTIQNLNISNKTIVSTAAGVPISKIKEWSNGHSGQHRVVRMMPNIPISNGCGSIIWYTKDNVNRKVLDRLCDGPTSLWVNDEAMIDSATAIFGCLPAYIAKYYEIYLKQALMMGFPAHEAKKMLTSTFLGTSYLLDKLSGDEIITQVASKGGATEKALEVLTDDGFDTVIQKAINESLDRIKNITKNLD